MRVSWESAISCSRQYALPIISVRRLPGLPASSSQMYKKSFTRVSMTWVPMIRVATRMISCPMALDQYTHGSESHAPRVPVPTHALAAQSAT